MSQASTFESVPDILPLLPLKDVVIFPHMVLPIFISEDICLKAVDQALSKDRLLFLSAFRSDSGSCGQEFKELAVSIPIPFDVYDIGTIASVVRARKLPDGRTKVLVQGLARGVVSFLSQAEPFPAVKVSLQPVSEKNKGPLSEGLIQALREQIEKVVRLNRVPNADLSILLEDISCPSKFSDVVAGHFGLEIEEAQKILGTLDPMLRLHRVQELLLRNLLLAQEKELSQKNQKDCQPKDTRSKFPAKVSQILEFDSEYKEEFEDLNEKIYRAGMNSEALTECSKQLKRLERMNQDSSEASLTRSYLECMVELPWKSFEAQHIDMTLCKKILDEDHYGLDKIKDRILEYLAVKKLNSKIKGPILCFVGPPGVGKTSLGKSIAKALGRKFFRLSLGGVREESEIRGHRRTYVGAMPGRIIQALKTVGVNNPVVMLDELDKLGSDQRGDPSSALLEVLDPEQNNSFRDHYLGVPYDLSQVIFLANANRLDTIPAPLRDRLEIIEVSGYTEEEKAEITKQYIVPKQMEQNGLSSHLVQIQDTAIQLVIQNYTRESGLRNLERNISAIARKLARYYAENDEKGKDRKPIKVSAKIARELLGEERFIGEDHNPGEKHVGIAIGLAYTQVGGEILPLEVKLFAGKGSLTLTGHLGDVMKESIQAALSCIRGDAGIYGIDAKLFQEKDIHLHIPQGAIPKDGPSAGIAIAMAFISAFRQEPLRQDIAMTGEVSLNGRVLPIGGVREKLLAALRNGITEVCVPEKNRGIFEELPLQMKRRLKVHFVSHISEVFQIFFCGRNKEHKPTDFIDNTSKNMSNSINAA